ncbi:hypothetical protein Patl1_17104 [Pistacia atlantica]|uniref:Uncharacterized protein n=1 Tax=Pistacia atlantica TaxID=434234 RepID=A0ACC1B979_9ROSI|nr:hypothetical protein Patl1_17104 [Pistacia atlantica]
MEIVNDFDRKKADYEMNKRREVKFGERERERRQRKNVLSFNSHSEKEKEYQFGFFFFFKLKMGTRRHPWVYLVYPFTKWVELGTGQKRGLII